MKQCTFKPTTNKYSIQLAEKRNKLLSNPEAADTSRSMRSLHSNRETHKTYEERHDDPTGFTFSPRINKNFKFTKERLFMNSPQPVTKNNITSRKKSKLEEASKPAASRTKPKYNNKDLKVTSLTSTKGRPIPLEMTFKIQMPHKTGMDAEAPSFVPIRISQQDGLQQVLRKSLDAAHQFFGSNHQITQDDMDYMVNQVIIKNIEAHKLYQEKPVASKPDLVQVGSPVKAEAKPPRQSLSKTTKKQEERSVEQGAGEGSLKDSLISQKAIPKKRKSKPELRKNTFKKMLSGKSEMPSVSLLGNTERMRQFSFGHSLGSTPLKAPKRVKSAGVTSKGMRRGLSRGHITGNKPAKKRSIFLDKKESHTKIVSFNLKDVLQNKLAVEPAPCHFFSAENSCHEQPSFEENCDKAES